MTGRFLLTLALGACLGAATAGFADEGGAGDGTRAGRPLSAADANAGKPLYVRECSGCHGERGDGAGGAAGFVDPRPRDFTKGQFKLRTTPTGQPPATADVLRVIERGIPGTAMPSFSFLAAQERKQIAAYVLKLADLLDEPEPATVPPPGRPPARTPQTIARGQQLYADAGCASCHGAGGRGDGESAPTLKDADDRPIRARDFTRDHFRGGNEPTDVYYRLMTGMDGTPMPSYAGAIDPPDLWAIVDYVASLRAPAVAETVPGDPIAAGRQVAAKYSCQGCHVLDDGRGGDVGPDLRVSAQKLYPEWVEAFLKAPREYGKIYPWRPARMPHLGLGDDEIGTMRRYLAAVGKRDASKPPAIPDPATFPPEKVDEGKLVYMLRCTECHNLGTVIETLPVKQQGPDLIRVARRLDYAWAKAWILNPKAIDPKTKMVVPNITPEQADAVRMFIWKAAIEADRAAGARASAR
jgi:cytochrome c oxidase cbb3-type subunit 2